MDTLKDVRIAAIDHNLNRSQVKALEGLKRVSHAEFQRIIRPYNITEISLIFLTTLSCSPKLLTSPLYQFIIFNLVEFI